MSSLILMTDIFDGPEELVPTNQHWDLANQEEAYRACDQTPMKAYLYLKDLETGEFVLVEAFE